MIDEQGRPQPPDAAGERETLVGFLEFQRATLAWKTDGLDADQLAARLPTSPMTLGGLLKHLAVVEDYWFSVRLHGRERAAPFRAPDWDADPDWDWHTAGADSPAELRAVWTDAVQRSRRDLDAALATGGLEQLEAALRPDRPAVSLRWILTHLVEEYSRHNGHADLLREAVDGLVGE